MVNNVKVSEFKNALQVTGFYLVRAAAIRASSNGKSMYGDFTLADETGEINAKMWDVSEASACPQTGQVVKVQGTVNEWQGRLQLRIERFRAATPEDEVDLSRLVPAAPLEPVVMLNTIEKYAEKIEDTEIRALVQRILTDQQEQLLIWPAALKNHHAVRGGLLYHTSTMLRLAEGMVKVYPFLRKDLLYAGAILHDMAKIQEINATNTGIATEYSRDGQLLGHIVQGILEVERVGAQLGTSRQTITLLQHMLLAHHYEPEYGSPRRPMFPEAEALHYLDIIDARLYDMTKALESTPEGGFSERLWTLHNRQLYHVPEDLSGD
ncbi:MAG: OB-fold nucleic acid binding domain-containing protein [Eubacteriales bacterium]|nr:OB-fold nucleic acid binding domain-containing protein [Eubacteriales bacterium]